MVKFRPHFLKFYPPFLKFNITFLKFYLPIFLLSFLCFFLKSCFDESHEGVFSHSELSTPGGFFSALLAFSSVGHAPDMLN